LRAVPTPQVTEHCCAVHTLYTQCAGVSVVLFARVSFEGESVSVGVIAAVVLVVVE
jgi:hypothetical protein